MELHAYNYYSLKERVRNKKCFDIVQLKWNKGGYFDNKILELGRI